jgi:hypothetical protein
LYRFGWPQLIAVTGLASAHAAIDEIIEQGAGARGDWRPAHYGRFLGIWTEYQQLREQDPSFEPARPVMPAFTQQPYDLGQPQPQPADPVTCQVAGLFNLGYEVLLHMLTRFFTHTDETEEQLDALAGAALGLMTGVLKPLGTALTRLPFGPASPRSHGRPGVPDVLPDRGLRAIARRRLGPAVRTHGPPVPAVRGNRQASRSPPRGQLRGGGRRPDRAADRRIRPG